MGFLGNAQSTVSSRKHKEMHSGDGNPHPKRKHGETGKIGIREAPAPHKDFSENGENSGAFGAFGDFRISQKSPGRPVDVGKDGTRTASRIRQK